MIPLSSRCCCVSSITTAFSWVDWFWHWRRKHKREVLKLLRGQILCGRHDAERIDFGFIRGRSLSLQRAMAWVDPSRNTSEDQCTGSNGGPNSGLAHVSLLTIEFEPVALTLHAFNIARISPRYRFGIVCIALTYRPVLYRCGLSANANVRNDAQLQPVMA